MNITLWTITILLALVFFGAGVVKLTTPRATLIDKGMAYAEDFSDAQIKGIGAVELVGAIGLIAPAFVGGLEWLVPTAATGLVLVMVGAIVTHIKRKEHYIPALILGILAAVVAVGRFWLAPLGS